MQSTISRLAKVLGASGVEAFGHDARFIVEGAQGGRLKISIEGDRQRFMCVLSDATGVTRTTIDVAPVTNVTEDSNFPGRVTLHMGKTLIHIDSKPTLAVEFVTPPPED